MLNNYQQHFIQTAIACGALKFGKFTLKSGRISPYFFNAGNFNSAQALYAVGQCYAEAILDASFSNIDILFGPAYKGIPLATCTATALHAQHNINLACAFNRKEEKKHGEGGRLIGAEIQGNVLIIDDVITAGTAVREVFTLLEHTPATVKGLIIGLNRQEIGPNGRSAVDELEQEYNIKVSSIINAHDLMHYLETQQEHEHLAAMQSYLNEFGTATT